MTKLLGALEHYALLAMLIVLPLLLLTAWAFHNRAERAMAELDAKIQAYDRLTGALEDQKRDARRELDAAKLEAETAGQVLADFKREQEADDEANQKTVAGLRARLNALHLARVRDGAEGAGGGPGGAGAPGAGAASAGGGAGDPADAGGILPAQAAGAGDAADDAFIADQVNIAYASCRADALKVREVLGQQAP